MMWPALRYIAQALRSRTVTTSEITIEPMIPSLLEKNNNMRHLCRDNGGGAGVFPPARARGRTACRTRVSGRDGQATLPER